MPGTPKHTVKNQQLGVCFHILASICIFIFVLCIMPGSHIQKYTSSILRIALLYYLSSYLS